MTIIDFSKHITVLKKEGKLGEALSFFKSHKGDFSKEQIASNSYLTANMLTVLRKRNYVNEAFTFLKIYDVIIGSHTDDVLLNSYGWLVFDKYRLDQKTKMFNAYAFIKYAEPLLSEIMRRQNVFFDTLIHILFATVIKAEKAKAAVNWLWVQKTDILPLIQKHSKNAAS